MNKKYIIYKATILVLGMTLSLMPFAAKAQNPLPTISNIYPSSANAGSTGITLTVNGTNFVAGSVISFNGAAKPTNYISTSQLTAFIPAGDLAVAGNYNVMVTNPTPGGGTSNIQVFTVTGGSVVPVITSISPNSKMFGGADFVLAVNGSNFNTNSVVNFNGLQRSTTYISANQLIARILTADVATVGTYLVTVFDPLRGTSNSVSFTVTSTPTVPNTGVGPIVSNNANLSGILNVIMSVLISLGVLSLVVFFSTVKFRKLFQSNK